MATPNQATPKDALAGKRLVILGLARQGKALARFAVAQGAEVIVSDLRSAETLNSSINELNGLDIQFVLGSHPLTLLDGTDMVTISGSVPADAPFVNAARERGIIISNDSQEFLRRNPAPTIGITGSAGKSTTTTLTGEMAKLSGKPTFVGGNIGRPLIAELDAITPESHVIQELSSFQLEIWQHSPHIAAILNVTPNHLDRHKTMDVYTEAKANILRFQSSNDIALLPVDELDHLHPLVQGRLREFSRTRAVDDGAFVRDDSIILRNGTTEHTICTLNEIQLLGEHNILNVLAACVLANSAEITPQAMREAIRNFKGIPHRLELVATINGAHYINDSIATAPERALAAIRAFNKPLILLAGGKDKDLTWSEWATEVAQRTHTVILFGHLADMVRPQIDATAVNVEQTKTLADAVARAHAIAQSGMVVLLSPGGTSFDAYQDFAERGEHFRQLVHQLEQS